MKFITKIKIYLPNNVISEPHVLDCIIKELETKDIVIEYNMDGFNFRRRISNKRFNRARILIEVINSFAEGKVIITGNTLYLRINYIKHFIVSIAISFIITWISVLIGEINWGASILTFVFFTFIFFVVGKVRFNKLIKKIIHKSL